MATTTPNFGWPVPTSTDLVKDGATAMEALGDAIDTSMVDLKGGTTGQVLAKASNTDMDFSWVAQDDSNAIQNTIVDAKGDLIAASAADTPARLAVGSNGETLVADSSTATGLRYQATQAAGKNYIINGGFDIWQRGTSFTPTAAAFNYCADRWYESQATGTSGNTMSQSTDAPTGFKYSLKTQRTNGTTGTANIYTIQSLETTNSLPLAGQTVTLSMWVKKGANWSGTNYLTQIYTGTGTDQGGFPSIWTGSAAAFNLVVTPTTSWVRYSATGTIASTATQIGLLSQWSPTGTAGADDSLYVTGVQLEIGSVPTQFTRAGGTIQGELAACTYYFERLAAESASNGAATFAYGLATSTTAVNAQLRGFARKRVAPTITFSGNTDFRVFDQVTATTTTAMAGTAASSMDVQGFGIVTITATVASGLTQYRPYFVIPAGGSGTRFIDISAEL